MPLSAPGCCQLALASCHTTLTSSSASTTFSSVGQTSLRLPQKRTPLTVFSTHPDNSGKSPHFKILNFITNPKILYFCCAIGGNSPRFGDQNMHVFGGGSLFNPPQRGGEEHGRQNTRHLQELRDVRGWSRESRNLIWLRFRCWCKLGGGRKLEGVRNVHNVGLWGLFSCGLKNFIREPACS